MATLKEMMMHSNLCLKRIIGFRSGVVLTLLLAVALATTAQAQTGDYTEAPGLAERVEAGDLPPVAERLPEAPMVVTPHERIGQYGGDWNTALLGAGDANWIQLTIGYEPLVRWNPDWTEVIPNIAERVEVNENSTEFTFYLRPGMKWSDGEPFTADDLLFWYEDVLMNEELTPAVPGWLTSGGEPVVVEKGDDTTVTFSFAEPYGLFLQDLATSDGSRLTANFPRHYLEQFHIKYNENANELAQEAGFETWVDHFQSRTDGGDRWRNLGLPTLHPWILTQAYSGTTSRVIAERNPYYWKVDPEGHQLPYLDRVVFDIIEDVEVLLLRVLNGDIDMQTRHIATANFRPVLFDGQEQGNYRLIEVVPAWSNVMVISLNLTHKDPVKREVFQNKDFRIGLSHAINRQELNDLFFLNQTEPWQAAPRPDTGLFDQDMAKQYSEYDVDLANEHLDSAGYAERDAQGFRLAPSGERISINIEVNTAEQEMIDMLELVEGYWEAVGIETQITPEERTLLGTRLNANEHDAVVWVGGGGLDQLSILAPTWYFPSGEGAYYAMAWGLWNQDPDDPVAEEPPAYVKRQTELYEQVKSTADSLEQISLMAELIGIAKEQFYTIGTVLQPSRAGIVKNNFHNVPTSMPQTWFYQDPGPTNPEQYFIEGGE